MNSHDNEKLVTFDHHENLAIIVEEQLLIQGEERQYKVPIVDGLVAFINLELYEMDENVDFVEGFDLPDHPYIELFKPEVIEENEESYILCNNHFLFLKNMFFRLITFCFDQNFFPEELSELTAYQRLYVYAKLQGGDVPQEVKQMHLFDYEVVDGFKETKKATPLEAAFSIPAGYVQHIKKSDAKMFIQYQLASTYDALSLEFYEMLDRNVKLKRCKNCNQYFVVKSKRNSDYCDRLANGGTQTCQQLAAVAKFAEKNKENRPYQIFNQYYKRYHERKKVGTIKKDIFDKWNKQACTMRDACIDSNGDVAAFEVWCYESFPNRTRKEKVVTKKPAFKVGTMVVFERDDDVKRGVIEAVNKNVGADFPDGFCYEIYVEEDESTYIEVFESEIIKKIDICK